MAYFYSKPCRQKIARLEAKLETLQVKLLEAQRTIEVYEAMIAHKDANLMYGALSRTGSILEGIDTKPRRMTGNTLTTSERRAAPANEEEETSATTEE